MYNPAMARQPDAINQQAIITNLSCNIQKRCRDFVGSPVDVQFFITESGRAIRIGICSLEGDWLMRKLQAGLFPEFPLRLFWKNGKMVWATVGFTDDTEQTSTRRKLYDHHGRVLLIG